MLALTFSINVWLSESGLFALLPITMFVAYFLGNGKLLPEKLGEKIRIFREGAYPLKEIDEAVLRLERGTKIDLSELMEKVNKIKKKLLDVAKVQRKLFIFSFILAPVFPVITTFGSTNLKALEKGLLLLSGYGGMFAVIFVAIAGINAFFRQVKGIADKINNLENE
ncbi:hypothetical protein AT15_05095 [Kosmotoga arenicorallina S304]|uniref:Uncharacterized protein n=2 Tax=Kosmotoga arenicorallina TaxID=688066 RepID=A0A176JUR5_9BACT|nr:hypothetical protein AT15_05095 [Kosmotoga arenicorallina S304]